MLGRRIDSHLGQHSSPMEVHSITGTALRLSPLLRRHPASHQPESRALRCCRPGPKHGESRHWPAPHHPFQRHPPLSRTFGELVPFFLSLRIPSVIITIIPSNYGLPSRPYPTASSQVSGCCDFLGASQESHPSTLLPWPG